MERLMVSNSGGLTSAYLSRYLRFEYSDKYEMKFVFSNTGLENEETLVFVQRCSEEFDLNVVWVEAVVNPEHGKGIRHKIVNFETAARNGEPFEAFIAKSGIPNANKPQCSDRLKALVIEDYKKSIGWKGCKHAIGIRKDEEGRKAKSAKLFNLVYPLCDWFVSDKVDVNDFWDAQNFTLGLEDHEGNCATCWKKHDPKLFLIALEHPERFDFMDRMENTYQHVKPNDNGDPRVFFRQNRTAKDIIRQAQEFDIKTLRRMIKKDPDRSSGCSESCEPYLQASFDFKGQE